MPRSLEFLAHGGTMGERIRAHDWASTPLGPPQGWPPGLRAMVRLMLTTQTSIFIYWGEQATCLYNDAVAPALGPERFETALGRSGPQVWSEIWDHIGPEIAGVRAGGGATRHQARFLALLEGDTLRDSWWNYSQSPIDHPESPNGIGGVLVISSEVTDTVRGQLALTAERTRLLSIFEHSSTFFAAATGPEHRFELTNEAYRTLIGRSDLYGRTVGEVLPEIAEQGLLAALDRVYQTGEPFVARALPVRLARTPGAEPETRWLDFAYHRLEGSDGLPSGIIAEGFDVTPRVVAEQAFGAANDALQAILAQCPDLILTIAADGAIKLVADSALDVLGYAPAELSGRPVAPLFGGPDEAARVMAQVISGPPLRGLEMTAVRSDGSTRVIRWALVWAAELQMVIAIGSDVSELLLSEERLREAHKMEAIGQLTGGVAHDFNNLLTVVIGSLETIVDAVGADPELEPLARLALSAAERGADVTSQLLSFARRQAQRPVAITGREVAAGFAPLARTALRENMHLELVGLTDDWVCLADRGQLQSALLNLCINGRDAMGSSGWLTITASTEVVGPAQLTQPGDPAPGVYARIEVTDTGVGMSPEVLAQAVEPFFTTKPVGQGTGLGLSMVYGFVSQSGGFLRIRSGEGLGTSVSLYLPCSPRPQDVQAPPVVEGGPPGARIIVVEDNELLRDQVTRQLRLFGHEVVVFDNAEEALDLIRRRPDFDLLFTDIVMPGEIDGRGLATRARAINPRLRVLFTTGYADQVHGEDEALPGPLLAKPYKSAALQDAICEALRISPPTGATPS